MPPSFLNERTAVQSLGWPPVEVEYFINDVICLFFLQSGQHSVSAGTEVSLSVALSGMCCACVSPKQLWCRQFSFFCPSPENVFVDEVPSDPPPHSTVCAGRGWVLLSTCASCRNSFQRVLCCIPVCVTPSFVSCSIARVYDTEEPFCFPPSSATATHRVTHRWKVLMRIVLVY